MFYILLFIAIIIAGIVFTRGGGIEGYKDYNKYEGIFQFDYDYQLAPIRFEQKCKYIGLIDEYFGGESDAYKDRYIPYILNDGFYELNRDY